MSTYYDTPLLPRIGERREPGVVLLLHIVTFGIYYLWWIYRTSEEMMAFDQEPDTSPALELLFSIISCGIYTVYWDYKTAQKIARMQAKVGIRPTDNSILYLVLNCIGLGLIPSMIEQGHLNEIWNRAYQINAEQSQY